MFKKAENMQAFLKMGIYGFAGSGKTYTSGLIAQGIFRAISSKSDGKPVYFIDTETGSDFLVKPFKKAGIDFYASKTRAFMDLLRGIEIAEKEASVLIIDSVSHFWTEIQSAYKKKTRRNSITIREWGILKEQWARFTDAYINSKVHIIVCGRARDVTDWEEGEDGKKEMVKIGTTMKTEKEMAYEPSLLVEMVRELKANKKAPKNAKLAGQTWDHTAYVLKDRSSLLEGKIFYNPTFKDFKPHFDFLNIGGEHVGVDNTRDSSEIFEDGDDNNWRWIQKQKEITLEEIQGEITSIYPSQSAKEKQAKADLINIVFSTRSWTKITDLKLDQLKAGLDVVRGLVTKVIRDRIVDDEDKHASANS